MQIPKAGRVAVVVVAMVVSDWAASQDPRSASLK
jgi:hypothetical protein